MNDDLALLRSSLSVSQQPWAMDGSKKIRQLCNCVLISSNSVSVLCGNEVACSKARAS